MADTMDAGDAAQRLEAALERIARAASRPRVAEAETESGPACEDQTRAIAARLDELIQELRLVLGSKG